MVFSENMPMVALDTRLLLWPDVSPREHGNKSILCLGLSMSILCFHILWDMGPECELLGPFC